MGSWKRVLEQARNSPANLRFGALCGLVEKFGFRLKGGKGSHRVYTRQGVFEILNLQNVGGKAKPYQVKQFLNLVDKYCLEMEER